MIKISVAVVASMILTIPVLANTTTTTTTTTIQNDAAPQIQEPIINALTMECDGYSLILSIDGGLQSHATHKNRNYPITAVDVKPKGMLVRGITQYGKITAFFSDKGDSTVVWTDKKDVVVDQCRS